MVTPFPLVLIGLPIMAAALAYLLRRLEAVAALLAALVAALLAGAVAAWPSVGLVITPVLTIPLGAPWTAGEQRFALEAAARPALVFLFGTATLAFLGAVVIPQGRAFAPGGLLVLSGFAATLLVHPLFMAPTVLAATAAIAVFFAQGGRIGPTRGALRQMLFPFLAFPFFLLAGWYMAQAPLNPDDPAPLQTAGRLFAWGFLFLLGAAPLHGAMPALLDESPPLAGFLLILGGNTVVLNLLLRFPLTYPWLAQQVDARTWLRALGLWTAVWGGAAAMGQRDFGRLLGYAAVHDYGAILLGLSLQGPLGAATMLTMLLARSLSLLTGASALSILRERMGDDSFARLRGAAARLPGATAGVLLGGLGLVGWPLTAGFGARWSLLVLLLEEKETLIVGLFALSAAGVALGYVRGWAALLGRIPPEQALTTPVEREPARATLWMGLLLLIAILMALAPQVIAPWVGRALNALTGAVTP